jgi:hypothetical protein
MGRKVGRITNDPEETYLFPCPGCGCSHIFRIPPWTWNGDFEKPTVGGSVLVYQDEAHNYEGNFRCHLLIKEGKIEFLSDCTHKLAGQTVEMEDI